MPMNFSGNSGMKKKYKIKMTASAQSDIRILWDYISQNNPENAVEFISEIEKRIYSLSSLPERNPVIPEGEFLKTSDYRHLIYKKYRIIYRIRSEIVYVLRIFHGSKLLGLIS
jgi:toxin ParE1/3/4